MDKRVDVIFAIEFHANSWDKTKALRNTIIRELLTLGVDIQDIVVGHLFMYDDIIITTENWGFTLKIAFSNELYKAFREWLWANADTYRKNVGITTTEITTISKQTFWKDENSG